jgi:hypothetical protein
MRVRLLAVVLGAIFPATAARAQDSYRLRESFPIGYRYQVSSRSELSGSLTVPPNMIKDGQPKTLALSGGSTIEYAERVLAADAGGSVQKTLRVYGRLDYRRKVGEQTQENSVRPAVRRMVVMRLQPVEVPFSPDGPMTWGEIDMVRTDIFTPALRGLLPEQDVRVGETWAAGREAVQELTDLEQVTDGQLRCRLHGTVTQNGRRYAHVTFTGTVSGVSQDGPNRQELDGLYYFDLDAQTLSYLSVHGTSFILDKDGKTMGRIEGRFVLTRRADPQLREVSDEAIRGLTLEPNEANTELLFHEPALGVQFVYPRRWTVRKADARQLTLDEPGGGGLLITLEPPSQTPSGPQFYAEVGTWLQKRSARVLRTEPPRRVPARPEEIDHFRYEVELDKQHVVLDYYVSRQPEGGAMFAARLPAKEAATLQRDVERIARSLKLIPPKR